MWTIALTTFVMVFLAELGDKTQLAVLGLATQTEHPYLVMVGAGCALLLSTALAVGLGMSIGRGVPEAWTKGMHYAAGGLFVAVGIWRIVNA